MAALDSGSQCNAASMEIDIRLYVLRDRVSPVPMGLTLSRRVVPYLGSEASRCQSVKRDELQSVPSPVFEVQRACAAFEN